MQSLDLDPSNIHSIPHIFYHYLIQSFQLLINLIYFHVFMIIYFLPRYYI